MTVFAFFGGMSVGCFIGIIMIALCKAASNRDDIDICKNCFGASMGDCPTCQRRKDNVDNV